MGSIRTRWLWATPDRVVGPCELRWDERGRITGWEPLPSHADVSVDAVVPGLVNAHAHLQLPPLAPLPSADRGGGQGDGRPRDPAPEPFGDWIGRVVRARSNEGADGASRRTEDHVRALIEDGCTAVGEIDSLATSAAVLGRLGVAGRCYQEVLGFDVDEVAAADLVAGRMEPGTRRCPGGLSPHAPYSTSAALFRAAVATGACLSIHAAETPEEQEFVRTGRGPFRSLLERLGKVPRGWEAPGCGVVEFLGGLGCLGPDTSLVHCQHLLEGDEARLVNGGVAVVVCPGTIEWFARAAPPVPAWLAAGIPVALGTDSRASNTAWSMRREMGRARQLWPQLAPKVVLAMATAHGARALSRASLGRLSVGARADFVALRSGATAAEILDAWTSGELAPTSVHVAGHPCVERGGAAP